MLSIINAMADFLLPGIRVIRLSIILFSKTVYEWKSEFKAKIMRKPYRLNCITDDTEFNINRLADFDENLLKPYFCQSITFSLKFLIPCWIRIPLNSVHYHVIEIHRMIVLKATRLSVQKLTNKTGTQLSGKKIRNLRKLPEKLHVS